MIQLLPYMEHEIECQRSAEEICAILKKVTDTRKGAFRNYLHTEFYGTVNSSGFRIFCDFRSDRFSYPVGSPVAFLRERYSPCVEGTISTDSDRSVVRLKLQLSLPLRIFMTIWFGGITFFFLGGILILFTGSVSGGIRMLIASAFLVPEQIMIRYGFGNSAEDIIDRLEELLL